MTTVEAAEAVTTSPVVILPAGAFEQHGPGMPLATDTSAPSPWSAGWPPNSAGAR